MDDEVHFRKLHNMYMHGPINRFYSPELCITSGKSEIAITVREDFQHSAGSIHGSVFFKLLDDSAYFAASSVIPYRMIVTASFNLYFIKPVCCGIIRGRGELVHRASRLIISESRVVDERNRVLAQGCGTFMETDIMLDEKVGYM
jgi:uncharacterized protein (TIGR00369 family)